MSVLALIVVLGTAVFFGGMGLYGLVAPASLVAPFGLAVRSTDARNEVRAVYGGFGLAMAGLLVVAAHDLAAGRVVLVVVAIALLGMAAGRLVSYCWERPTALYPVGLYLAVEAVLGGLLVLAASVV